MKILLWKKRQLDLVVHLYTLSYRPAKKKVWKCAVIKNAAFVNNIVK